MEINDIVDYVMETPHNSNKQVLESMLTTLTEHLEPEPGPEPQPSPDIIQLSYSRVFDKALLIQFESQKWKGECWVSYKQLSDGKYEFTIGNITNKKSSEPYTEKEKEYLIDEVIIAAPFGAYDHLSFWSWVVSRDSTLRIYAYYVPIV